MASSLKGVVAAKKLAFERFKGEVDKKNEYDVGRDKPVAASAVMNALLTKILVDPKPLVVSVTAATTERLRDLDKNI